MRLADPQRTRRAIGLTPLIDVVFLLLIFFMLASTFLKFGTVKLETVGSSAAPVAVSEVILIHVSDREQLTINGQAVVHDAVADLINARVAEGAKTAVLVARDSATVADLVKALRRVRGTDVGSVRVIE